MPESAQNVLTVADEYAKDKRLHIEICDVATFIGRLKAWLDRMDETPTIPASKSRIRGKLDTWLLVKKLDSCQTQELVSTTRDLRSCQ